MYRRPLSIALLGSLAALVLLQLPLPFGGSLWAQTLENAAHAPLFGLLALLIHRALRARRPPGNPASAGDYLRSGVLTVAIGAATEIAQWFTGRDASLIDLANDALGAAFALAAMAWWRGERKGAPTGASPRARRMALAIAILAALPVIAPVALTAAVYWHRSARMPVIWNYRTPLDRELLSHPASDVAVVPVRTCLPKAATTDAQRALRVRWSSSPTAKLMIDEPYPDWRGFRELQIEAINTSDAAMTMAFRVHDAQHNNLHDDRFNTLLTLSPAQRTTLRIALGDIERAPRNRSMNMSRIAGMIFFPASREKTPAFCLVSVTLAH